MCSRGMLGSAHWNANGLDYILIWGFVDRLCWIPLLVFICCTLSNTFACLPCPHPWLIVFWSNLGEGVLWGSILLSSQSVPNLWVSIDSLRLFFGWGCCKAVASPCQHSVCLTCPHPWLPVLFLVDLGWGMCCGGPRVRSVSLKSLWLSLYALIFAWVGWCKSAASPCQHMFACLPCPHPWLPVFLVDLGWGMCCGGPRVRSLLRNHCR